MRPTKLPLNAACLFVLVQLGEVKGLIRLLQDHPEDLTAGGAPPAPHQAPAEVLTLPALQKFVEGGEAYLARRANEAQKLRRQGRCKKSKSFQDDTSTALPREKSSAADKISRREITRASSWSDEELDKETQENTEEREERILGQLQSVLSHALQSSTATTISGGDGRKEDCNISSYLSSFDLDDDGRLSRSEFASTLFSLGGQGRDFGGGKGMRALALRFGDETGDVIRISEVVNWFESRTREKRPSKASVGDDATKGVEKRGDREREMTSCRSGRGGRHEEVGNMPAEALRRAIRMAESRGTTLERTFARLDEDGDGFITLRQLLRGLDQMRVFEKVGQRSEREKELLSSRNLCSTVVKELLVSVWDVKFVCSLESQDWRT